MSYPTPAYPGSNHLRPVQLWSEISAEDGETVTEASISAVLAAITHAEIATQSMQETVGLVAGAADNAVEITADAARAVAVAVQANAAVFAAAAAAAEQARHTEARLIHEVLHDGLTGLPNRRLLLDRLTQSLARSRRLGTYVAVMFLDLDSFKSVNDTFGHAAGDQLLIGVSARLLECLRDTDTCARVGGDEFVVICDDLGQPTDGLMIAGRLAAALASGVTFGDHFMPVRATIGTAVSTSESQPGELLHQADIAMYAAKGGNITRERRRRDPNPVTDANDDSSAQGRRSSDQTEPADHPDATDHAESVASDAEGR